MIIRNIVWFIAGAGIASGVWLAANFTRDAGPAASTQKPEAARPGKNHQANTAKSWPESFAAHFRKPASGERTIAELGASLDEVIRAQKLLAEEGEAASKAFRSDLAAQAARDPRQALAMAKATLSGWQFDQAVEIIFPELAKVDPAFAETQLIGLSDESRRTAAISLARIWGTSDAVAAFGFVGRLHAVSKDTETRELASDVYRQVLNGYMRVQPAAAGGLIAQLRPSAVKNEMVELLAARWSASEPEQAALWAAQVMQADPTVRGDALREIVGNWAHQSPDEAWAFLLKNPAMKADATLITAAVSAGTQKDAAATARYFGQLPETSRAWAAGAISETWLAQDADAALAWIAGLPGGPIRDEAMGSTINHLLHFSGERTPLPQTLSHAFGQAQQIQEPAKREQFLKEVAGYWAHADATAARAMVSSANLAERERVLLLRVIAERENRMNEFPDPVLPKS